MSYQRGWTRREWLSAMLATAGAGLLASCGIDDDEDSGLIYPSFEVDHDIGLIHLLEPDILITKGPFVQWLSNTTARIRWESDITDPIEIQLDHHNGHSITAFSEVTVEDVEFYFPTPGVPAEFPDIAGMWAMHEVTLTDLSPDDLIRWTLTGSHPITGSFRTPPTRGTPSTIGWIADTMFPKSEGSVAVVAEAEPDLVLHGGDLQYQTNPFDTWNGLFHFLRPLTSQAAFHCCPGNHEYETFRGFDEFDQQYRRLFDGQGHDGGNIDYYALDWAGLRIIMLNSEIEGGFKESDDQLRWLEAELQAAQDRPDISFAIVAYHRPFFTFSKARANRNNRALLHPLFQQYKVPLVLCGHNHCFERFTVDGITYIVDGGGGASTYDVNHTIEDVEANDPHLLDTRHSAYRDYGGTIIEVLGDDTLSMRRISDAGELQDSWEVGPL